MSGIPHDPYEPKTGAERWIERRLPILGLIHSTLFIPTPKNLNWMWIWGMVLAFCLVLQIATGVVLAMHYTPNISMAFASVEHIMRDVNAGWALRYVHANGASLFFFAVYAHIFRGIYYGSYKEPREITWIIGMLIFLLMMATAFMGYVLPWGQMSFWGATVITGLFSALPLVGPDIQTWLLGGPAVDNPTLNRFFSLHYLLPFVIAGLVIVHIWAFHTTGNNNPTGVEVRRGSKEEARKDTLPFWPYFVIKDVFALVFVLVIFAAIVGFMPNFLGHPDNYVEANPLKTPAHIVPEWYFLPFYAILRSIPNKLIGVCAMFASILVLFILPWLDRSPVRSGSFRPAFKRFFWTLVFVCAILMFCGKYPPANYWMPFEFTVVTPEALQETAKLASPDDLWAISFAGGRFGIQIITLGQLAAIYYFAYFIIILPLLSIFERTLPLPLSISRAVLEGKSEGALQKPALAGSAEKQ
jgi:ubiquinol-cytochrome c reductase cytochrome b subunit